MYVRACMFVCLLINTNYKMIHKVVFCLFVCVLFLFCCCLFIYFFKIIFYISNLRLVTRIAVGLIPEMTF